MQTPFVALYGRARKQGSFAPLGSVWDAAVLFGRGKRKRIRILTNDERRPGRWPGRPFRR